MNKQVKIFQSDPTQLEPHIIKTLNGSFPLPETVRTAQNEAYAKVRALAENQKAQGKQRYAENTKNRKFRPKIGTILFRSFAGASAAAIALACVCMANPSIAAQIPVVGHIFETLGESLKFAGNYTKLAEPVKVTESEMENMAFDGATITCSEAYCNEAALYLGLIIQSEEKFPETLLNQDGKPVIEMKGSVDFDFDQEEYIDWEFGGDSYIDGKMTDENTYTGVVRFDMGQYFAGQGIEIPENFQVKLAVSQIVGTKLNDDSPKMPQNLKNDYEAAMKKHGLGLTEADYEQFTDAQKEIEHQLFTDMWNAYYEQYPDRLQYPNSYQNWLIDGSWDFKFDVTNNRQDVIHIDIHDLDENGLGIVSVTKTPVEITVETEQNMNYFVAILDADGNLMTEGDSDGNINTVSVSGYDTSTIDVYICDYVEYMDELKGYWHSDDYEEKAKEKTFKQLLNERSLYHKEIPFHQ